jgi:hypothetical protein
MITVSENKPIFQLLFFVFAWPFFLGLRLCVTLWNSLQTELLALSPCDVPWPGAQNLGGLLYGKGGCSEGEFIDKGQ